MKNIRTIYCIIATAFVILAQSCDLDVVPTDQISSESLPNTDDGIVNVTNGNYALFKEVVEFNGIEDWTNNYVRQYFQMSDFAGDDIVCGQVSTDPLYYSFTFTHSPSQGNARYFWYVSYKIINGCNTVIEITENMEDKDDLTLQLLGENYFLRAFSHFNLLKFYAKPYTQGDPADNLGIIIRGATTEESKKARASVGECYDFIIGDLETAADLMNEERGKMFASREAAWALLSRVYLYMENHEKSIEYADKVINSGSFTLETAASFPNLFANATSQDETIFAIAFTPADNIGKGGSIGSMLYSDGNSGWGEEFASQSIRELMDDHMEDIRWSYILPTYTADSSAIAINNGIPIYYITKFSFQDGDPNLSSPIMFRLAEMYLNRAEANAKLGNESEALADVNEIRRNRGLENALINSVPEASTILNVVLNERRIELAFEGHRIFDILRNKQDLHRNYWGYHLIGLKVNQIDLSTQPSGYDNLIVKWDDPKILYYIPVDEILANDLCIQNE